MSVNIELLEEEAIVLHDILQRGFETGEIRISDEVCKSALLAVFSGIESYMLPGCDQAEESKRILAESQAYIKQPHQKSRVFPLDTNDE